MTILKKELIGSDKKLLNDIKKIGWHVVHVPADTEGPGFSFSVGLFKTFKHPEIIIIGLKIDLAHVLINNIGEDVSNKKKYQSGKFYSGILDDFKCFMLKVSEKQYKEYLGTARGYYRGDDFPVLQCIFPTVTGKYPWEWPKEKKYLQPILGDLHASKKKKGYKIKPAKPSFESF